MSIAQNILSNSIKKSTASLFDETIRSVSKTLNIEEGSLSSEYIAQISKEFHSALDSKTPTTESPPQTTCKPCSPQDTRRDSLSFNPCKCRARVFGSGKHRATGPQCSKKHTDDSPYCKKHSEQFDEHGCVDFGNFDEDRPDTSLVGQKSIAWIDSPKKSNAKKSSPKSSKKNQLQRKSRNHPLIPLNPLTN